MTSTWLLNQHVALCVGCDVFMSYTVVKRLYIAVTKVFDIFPVLNEAPFLSRRVMVLEWLRCFGGK